jgi:hypothetical protein
MIDNLNKYSTYGMHCMGPHKIILAWMYMYNINLK